MLICIIFLYVKYIEIFCPLFRISYFEMIVGLYILNILIALSDSILLGFEISLYSRYKSYEISDMQYFLLSVTCLFKFSS